MAIRVNRPDARGGDSGAEPVRTSTTRRRVAQVQGAARVRDDVLAVEEPLEIRLYPSGGRAHTQVSVTMRTPGHDFELACGFLFTEGILGTPDQVDHINYCADRSLDSAQRYNIVNVYVRPGVPFDRERLRRNFYASSSCGVCGKASIEAVRVQGIRPILHDGLVVDGAVFARASAGLREGQTVFEKTGGLHAAALFDGAGRLLAIREDVGRHNAVDKLIGHAFLDRALPLSRCFLMVSGRTSFEIMQKAAAGGVPLVAGISAPSSLACDVARAFGMTLVGFVRGDRFSVYAGAHRISLGGREIAPLG